MLEIPPEPDTQQRHESPDVGDAVVRMLRALVTRSAWGDTFAIEQLARIEQLAPLATSLGLALAHDHHGSSYTHLAAALGTSRQAARQRAAALDLAAAHEVTPGHRKRECGVCLGKDIRLTTRRRRT